MSNDLPEQLEPTLDPPPDTSPGGPADRIDRDLRLAEHVLGGVGAFLLDLGVELLPCIRAGCVGTAGNGKDCHDRRCGQDNRFHRRTSGYSLCFPPVRRGWQYRF